MAYLDNQKKFVVILNSKTSIPRLANALVHAMIGLSSGIKPEDAQVSRYESADSQFTALISRYPVIVLEAKNGSQLRALYESARNMGLATNAFVGEMIAESHEAQMVHVRSKPASDLDMWVVALYGDAEDLRPLTKKFSLMRERAGEGAL